MHREQVDDNKENEMLGGKSHGKILPFASFSDQLKEELVFSSAMIAKTSVLALPPPYFNATSRLPFAPANSRGHCNASS